MQTTETTKITTQADPKIHSTKAELERLEEHEAELKAEYAKKDLQFKRTPDKDSHAERAVAEQLWVNASEETSTKRGEYEKLLDVERKAERQRRLLEIFAKVDPKTTVAPTTERIGDRIRSFATDIGADLNALARAAELYNATLPQMHELGGGGCEISLEPELKEIQRAIADLAGARSVDFDRMVQLQWINSSPTPFWKLEIHIPGSGIHAKVRPQG